MSNNVSKIKLDLTDEDSSESRELERTKKAIIPLMIIYPANPERPGVFLDGVISPEDALKALKYAIKYS
jgi:thiol:disulfide interchange protein